MDSTLLQGTLNSKGLEKDPGPMFTIGKHTVTVGQFVGYLQARQNSGKSLNIDAYIDQQYKEFVQEEVIAYEDARLPEKYPDFRHIYQEYHDGILLFDIMDKMVWSRAVSDTLGLAAFHEQHRNDYTWQERTDAILVTCSRETDLAGVRKVYKRILKGKLDQEKLNSMFCSNDTVQCIILEEVLVEQGENEMVDARKGEPGLGPVVQGEGTDVFVILKKVIPPQPKELSEARGQITSDYQTYLEEKWIEELRQKYPVEVNKEVLAGINP
jgi:peptidyl-prolyl cis-trans isomerase SurA